MILSPSAPAVAPEVAVATAPAGKPLSASCCHLLALFCFVGAVAWIVSAVLGYTDDSGFYIGAGCGASAAFWWALGDIVAAVHRATSRP